MVVCAIIAPSLTVVAIVRQLKGTILLVATKGIGRQLMKRVLMLGQSANWRCRLLAFSKTLNSFESEFKAD